VSRTYKRNVIKCEGQCWRKFAKRQAAKSVRRAKNVPDGRKYRQIYDSWGIYDLIFDMRYDYWEIGRGVHRRFKKNGQWYYYT
jgi:hypothetical protein